MDKVTRIVLTGGPCGGKTTALEKIAERLRALGQRVFMVPEVPTMVINGGATFAGASLDTVMAIEGSMLGLQMALEDHFLLMARRGAGPAVVLCDRGTIDVSAYVPPSMWQGLLDENGWSQVALRDQRYDAVVHLVTAAEGAEAFYTTANNAARRETPEQARKLDERLRDVWVGHPRLRVIDNSTDFKGKVRRVVQAVCHVVGEPEPVEIERKFLVRAAPSKLPVQAAEVEIEQTYLAGIDGTEERVRRRGQSGSFAYTHTIKRPLAAGQRVEVARTITAREYLTLLGRADPRRQRVHKLRTCFLWKKTYFELDRFIDPRPGLALLEAELERTDDALSLPDFIQVEREVTGEAAFYSHVMALRG